MRGHVSPVLMPQGMELRCVHCVGVVCTIRFGARATFDEVDDSIRRHIARCRRAPMHRGRAPAEQRKGAA